MPNNDFTISGSDAKVRRVWCGREYLIEILKKSFPDLDFPMCYQGSEWTIEPQYDPMDMGKYPKLTGLVITRRGEKTGS